MASVNKVILIGNLTRDPEVRFMPNGEAVANFAIATNEKWKDKSGNKQEKTEFHNVVMYRKLAEIAGEYLKKGRPVYIEGRLQTREWEKDGVKRYTTEIIADSMQMLGGRDSSGGDVDRSGEYDQTPRQSTPKPAARPAATGGGSMDDFEDDIPFADPYKFAWRVV